MTSFTRLKDLGVWASGGTPPKVDEAAWKGDLPWLSAKDIDRDTLRAPTAFITEDAAELSSRVVPEGSLLIIARGMALAHGLPVALTDRRAAFNQDLRALVPSAEHEPRFLHYSLRGARNRLGAHIDKAAHGTARVIDSIYSERVWAPNRNRQATIATYLDRECERISALHSSIATARAYAAESLVAERYRLFRGAELDRALKAGQWPPGWSRLTSHVAAWYAGGTPEVSDPDNWDDDEAAPEWLAIGDMSGRRYAGQGSRRLSARGISSGRLRPAPRGTLLLAMYASVGEVAELDREAYFNQALIGMRIDDQLSREFIYEWLLLVRPHLSWFAKSNTQPNLTADLVRKIPVAPIDRTSVVSALEVLRRGAATSHQLDAELRTLDARLTEYRDALITEAVTGQLDVTKMSEAQMDERLQEAVEAG